MDKYEYKLKLEQLRNLVAEKDYSTAAEIADSINWRKVRNSSTLCMVGEIYEKKERYEDSKEILLMAYDHSPIGRNIICKLTEVAILAKNVDDAEEYYNEFAEVAPNDTKKYILRYKISCMKKESITNRISILEELKEKEYTEEWAFELAKLYHEAGQGQACVDACDELILWFGDGIYVERALELKMLYQPLNKMQEEKYEKYREKRTGIRSQKKADSEEESIVAKAVKIPPIVAPSGKFSTVNLQEELAKGMQQIMNATEKDAVSDTMDSIKKMVGDLPYMQVEKEEEPTPVLDEDVLNEQIDHSLKEDFKEFLEEDPEGKISVPVPVPSSPLAEPQVDGQMSIEDVLTEWEKTRRAAEAAIAVADQKKLEVAKRKALLEAEELLKRLKEVTPILEAEAEKAAKAAEEEKKNLAETLRTASSQEVPSVDEEAVDREAEAVENDAAEESASSETEADVAEEAEAASSEAERDADGEAEATSSEAENDVAEEAESASSEAERDTDGDAESASSKAEDDVAEEAEATSSEIENEAESVRTGAADALKTAKKGSAQPDLEAHKELLEEIEKIAKESAGVEEILSGTAKSEALSGAAQPEALAANNGQGEIPDADEKEVTEVEKASTDTEDTLEDASEKLEKAVVEKTKIIQENSSIAIPKEMGKPAVEEIPEVGIPEDVLADIVEPEEIEEPITMTPEMRKLFSYFLPVPGMEEQISQILMGASMRQGTITSLTGNIIIQGEEGSGKTVLATSLIKAIQMTCEKREGKIGKISAAALNKKDFASLVPKLGGGYLIIERASDLLAETAAKMSEVMEGNTQGLVVVLEDTRAGIKEVLALDYSFAKKFSEKINIPIFTIDELVDFGKSYAAEMECSIDEMGVLAMYNRINNIQKIDQATTLAEVKEIVDSAIESAEKGGLKKAFGVIFSKKYNENDYLILHEKDFEV